jgi:hypothetical protein
MDTASIRYFHLPIVDLSEVLNENAAGSKFYMGLENKKKGGQEIKLMLVGTRKDGSDLIDYENGNYVYDFSKSCPPFCDDEG